MLRNRFNSDDKAQVLLEYALVIVAVIMVLVAMSTMIKRASQGMIKAVADQIGNQEASDQRFDDSGHLEYSYSSARSSTVKTKNEFVGQTTYTYADTVTTVGNALINLGYTEN